MTVNVVPGHMASTPSLNSPVKIYVNMCLSQKDSTLAFSKDAEQ
jgi:hypothetical protein